jgi:hypothetical protein
MSKTTSTIKTESVTDTNETDTDTDKFIKMCMSGKINDAKQFYIYIVQLIYMQMQIKHLHKHYI